MARNTIYRGDDKKITLTLKDKLGVAINLTTLSGYLVILYNKLNNTVVQKYSKNVATGYKTILELDSVNGIIQVNLQSSDTSPLNVNTEIDCEIKTQKVDAAFDELTFHTLKRGVEIG